MSDFTPDYIVVGGGSAGAVMAERLSADGAFRVLLLEAGPARRENHPFVMMPKGIGKVFEKPDQLWAYQTDAYDDVPSETWLRGRLLGGSSAINGMMYFRGQQQDFDEWKSLGAPSWGWDEMRRVYDAMEADLDITVDEPCDPLSEAFIAAGVRQGVPRVSDLNNPDQFGIGYVPQTVSRGRRMSSARAFLDRARKRPNLMIRSGVEVDRILFEGSRAVGVIGRSHGERCEYRTQGEIILCAGAINSPALLQRSGIGAPEHLRSLGIDTVAAVPEVGENLREHRTLTMAYDLNVRLGENHEYRGGRLIWNAARYFAARRGPLARAPFPVSAFVKSSPEVERADLQIILGPFMMAMLNGASTTEAVPSLHIYAYPTRPRSRGQVRIAAADPAAAPAIIPRYLSDEYDREVTARGFRLVRNWMRDPAIAPLIARERTSVPELATDEAIVTAYRTKGQSMFHSSGTCRMGNDPGAVVDDELRVAGTTGLRVADASIMPTMPSCNTNGPAMAIGWRGAEIILRP